MDLYTLRDFLDDRPITSVLEVECGRGENLLVFRDYLGKDALLAGVDPRPDNLNAARAAVPDATFANGNALGLPFPDASFDLVFIQAVHIQIAHGMLHPSLAEIVRCTRRYLFAIEYRQQFELSPGFLDIPRSHALDMVLVRNKPLPSPDPSIRPYGLLFEKSPP